MPKNDFEATTTDIMNFLKDHMVMKEDFENFKKGATGKFDGLEQRFDGLEQRFDGLEQKMEAGFAQLWTELRDIKESIKKLEQRTREDADAESEEILSLKQRVKILEEQFKRLQSVVTAK